MSCAIGWSDASWACRRERSPQSGHLVRITNISFLERPECKAHVVSGHNGKSARVARSSNANEWQAVADAEEELTYVRLALWETFGGTSPLKNSQEAAAQVSASVVLDSR